MTAPTTKQIRLVDNICRVLNITDFPFSSSQFTKYAYSKFIAAHIEEYNEVVDNTMVDEDWCYEFCQNEVWTEHY